MMALSAVCLTTGAVIGALYCLSLRRTVQRVMGGCSPLKTPVLQLTRFAVVAVTLGGIAMYGGALALLLAFVGFMISRIAFIRLGLRI
jgi:hypothetical protein